MADSSLDDYIKTNHITRSGRGSGSGGGSGRGGRVTRGGFQRRENNSRFNGGVTKNFAQRKAPAFLTRNSFSGGQDRWQHDLFGGGVLDGGLPRSSLGGTGGTKLLISNLEYGVTDNDIRELFSEFGTLRKSALHYDQAGRSIGTAEVIFAQTRDAVAALGKYNGIPLDGRAMNIQLIGGLEPGMRPFGNPQSRLGEGSGPGLSFGGSRYSGGGGRGRGGGRTLRGGSGGGSGGRTGFQKRQAKPEVTQEQLDMELEEYQSHPV